MEHVELRYVIPIRWATLRPGEFDTSRCTYAGDKDARAIHVRALIGRSVVGVLSLIPDQRNFEKRLPAVTRIRGLGVLASRRGHGIGRALLEHGLHLLHENDLLPAWGSGRVTLSDLYMELGAVIVSDSYEIPGTGPHVDFYVSG